MNYADIAVRLDALAARDRAAAELQSRGFRLTWQDGWYAVAERGDKVSAVIAGAFAPYFKVGIRVMGAPSGETVVRFEKLASGWMSGWIGAMRVDKQMKDLRDSFAAAFDSVGLLAGVSEG